mgnify:FL=1
MFYAAIFLVSSAFYGTLLIETGKVNPLEQLKVNRGNTELGKKEAERRYNVTVYGLFKDRCNALADLNKDCKVDLEEITIDLKAMGVTQGNLERAVIDYLDGKVGKIRRNE